MTKNLLPDQNPSLRRWLLLLLYSAIVLAPPVLATALGAVGHPDDSFARVATNLALTGFAMVCMQFVISARFRWIERPFGLDALLRFHRKCGVWAGVFLLAHPLLLVAGESGIDLLYSLDASWFIWFGRIAILVLIAQIVASVFRAALGLEFETWRRLHNLSAWSILILGFAHSWTVGSAFEATPLRIYWVVLGTLAVGAAIRHKLWRPAKLRRHSYRVAAVERETHEVCSVTLEPDEGGLVPEFHPGQFHFLSPSETTDEVPLEDHPFTISSCPTERRQIISSIKNSGDFTNRIPQMEAGDRVAVHGPFGRFSYVFHPKETRLLFIAGGIGITPLMSMLRHMRNSDRSDLTVTLLYANKTADNIVFKEELDEIAAAGIPALKVIHVLSDPSADWDGETGHIEKELVSKHFKLGESPLCGAYLCAPPKMMTDLSGKLREMGLPQSRIHLEAFAL